MFLSIFDLDMSADYDLVETEGEIFDVKLSCNHQTISNLVRARIQAELDWSLFVENINIDESIITQQLRFIIDGTYGVISSDFSNFSITRLGRNLDISGICFTVDCDNSQECIVL